MTDYTSLANAIKTTVSADGWLGNTGNVKTIEIHRRGFSLQDSKDAQFFSEADIPAIAIIPNASPKQQRQVTTNEILETIPCEISAVSRDRDFKTGMTAHLTLVQNIERVLEKQKSSVDDFGIDAFVQQVATTESQFKKGHHFYFISTTTARIELTASF
jgi:lipopolysaccharide biosynthesis protein